MLKDQLNECTWFYDLEWVPDAASARRLIELPEETSELDAIKALWKYSGATDDQDRPFVKYLFSRVVSIAFLSRKAVYREGEPAIEFSLNSLPKLPLESDTVDEAAIIERFLYIVGERKDGEH